MRKVLFIILSLFVFPELYSQGSPQYVFSNTEGKLPVIAYKGYHYVTFPLTYRMTAYLTLTNEEITEIEVFPRQKEPGITQTQNTVMLTLYEPGSYMVRLNNKHRFFIFAEKEYELPDRPFLNITDWEIDNTGKENCTIRLQQALDQASESKMPLYFPAGEYKTFPLEIKSNTHIFLDRDAVIRADTSDITPYYSTDELTTKRFVYIRDAENIRIEGTGEIDGNGRAIRQQYGDEGRMRLMMICQSKNVTVEGIRLKDPGSWNTQILCSEDITFRNVKLMNDIELSNTDGFDPDASKRVLIEDCFAYCSDDNVAIKITNISGFRQDVEDITIRNCLFLTKKSSLKIGTETRGNTIKNILFENNEVVESDRGMAIYVRDGAVLTNIRYINNHFVYNYPDAKQCGIHFVVDKRKPESELGSIKDVLVRDCSFATPFAKLSEIKAQEEGRINVKIENLQIAGERCETLDESQLRVIKSAVEIK